MTRPTRARLGLATASALAAALVLTPLARPDAVSAAPGAAALALARLQADADRPLTLRTDPDGALTFVGVPAGAEVDDPRVGPATPVPAAADAALARYGPALGTTAAGSTFARAASAPAVSGDVVRYQQSVAGVPVLAGEVVVGLRADRGLASLLANASDETTVAAPLVAEATARGAARAAFAKHVGSADGLVVEAGGRWLLDPAVVGGDPALGARGVWRFELSRGPAERRLVLVDDRTGAVLVDHDLIAHLDRVVCDAANLPVPAETTCTAAFARQEGGAASAVTDVNTAYDLAAAVSEFYATVGGVDLTQLLGVSIGGTRRLAQTVRFCYTGQTCPYANAFWNGTQMYYGTGYAVADDVVGHEMTHGFTERNSNLVYWGQSGAINESLSDIVGEIVDHRHAVDGESPTSWALGEDLPGLPSGIRNVQDPTLFNDPDRTSSPFYVKESSAGWYADNDGVHANSGVGNKTFYLISQGGSFNGRTITGIDTDPGLTKSGRLWLLVDQSLTSGSDYADLAAVLDQSCQTLLGTPGSGFTGADCTQVHQATLATELLLTPALNPQPADAAATCPADTSKRVLVDSESGDPAGTFTAGPTWSRDGTPALGQVAHRGADAWASSSPATVGSSALVLTSPVTLPAGQASYLHFQQWRLLEHDPAAGDFYDGGTVEIDAGGGPVDTAAGTWVNGPQDLLDAGFGNPAAGRLAFGGDSRGYVASRLDLQPYAGSAVRPRFTLNSDNAVGMIGWYVDDVTVYTCDPVLRSTAAPTVTGSAAFPGTLTAGPGAWTGTSPTYGYQWLRDGTPVAGATGTSYALSPADVGHRLAVRVRATTSTGTADADSAATDAVRPGTIGAVRPTVSGKARVGKRLTARAGDWPAGVALGYQWLRGGKPIAGATGASYRLGRKDAGAKVSVRVTGTAPGYTPASAVSKATGKVRRK